MVHSPVSRAVLALLAAAVVSSAAAAEDSNIRIVVTHDYARSDRRDSVKVGVRPRIQSTRSSATGRTQQQLLVMSGGQASITVAEEVPYTEWFWTWGRSHRLWAEGEWTPSTSWQQVGASLVVEPTALGDGRIRVRLTPRFSYFLDRRQRTTDVHQLATEVLVRAGEEIDVGGLPTSDREFFERFLLGVDRSGSTQAVSIRLRASVEPLSP